MNKLIQLTETHYIVVDDSEIKLDEWCIELHNEASKSTSSPYVDKKGNKWWLRQMNMNCNANDPLCKKIIGSTEPLEEDVEFIGTTPKIKLGFVNIKPLSLSEIEEAINGYSVEKMADRLISSSDNVDVQLVKAVWKEGFKAHQELVKDKLFTVDDVVLAFRTGIEHGINPKKINTTDYIKSLLPKTEWDVTFDEQGKLKLI